MMRVSLRWMMLLTLAVVGSWAVAGPAQARDLTNQALQLLKASDLRDTDYSLYAVDLQTGEALLTVDVDTPRIPASNMKLVTTAAALDILGPDFVFRTPLTLHQQSDELSSETTLTVVGDGDPGFADPELLAMHKLGLDDVIRAWVDAVREAGVQRVDRLVVDDRVFDRDYIHDTWPTDQLNRWYCAQIAGFNFNSNCFDVFPAPTGYGQSPQVTIMPEVSSISETNRAVTGKRDTFWIARKLGTNQLIYNGKVKHRRTTPVYVTMHNPPAVFAQLLGDRLEQAEIPVLSVGQPDVHEQLPRGRELHIVQTTLRLILQRCNKDSQNMFADALLKRMGRQITGAPGGWRNGAAAVRQFLRRDLGTLGASIQVADGSGMSRENRVTARSLLHLLRAMDAKPEQGRIFRESLSLSGEDGTLQRRLDEEVTGKVYGKSGYLRRVSALSGYLVREPNADSERSIAFVFLFNDFKPPVYVHRIKEAQDKLVRLLDDHLGQEMVTEANASNHGG